MDSFRTRALIPISVAAAGWFATGPFRIPLFFRVVCVLSLILLAVLAGLPSPKRNSTDPHPEAGIRWTLRGVILTLGMIVLGAAALGSGIWGYLLSRTQPQQGGELQSARPNPQSATPSDQPRSSTSLATDKPAPATGKSSPAASGGTSELDAFVNRYVDTGVLHLKDQHRWAFLISDQNRADLPELNAATSEAIAEAGYRNVTLFRPALIRDGKLDELYDADPALMRRLADLCEGVVLAKAESNLVRETEMQGVHTIELALRVRVIAASTGVVKKEFSILERGAGFTLNEAETNARQRTAQKLKQQLKAALS